MSGQTLAAGNLDTSSTTTTTSSSGILERRCENADCTVVKLMSMVPKRKATQFLTEPCIKDKPLLINGFTTVFQIEGNSAKLMDLKNPSNANAEPKTIYRVVPNTHAHIVNYVVVDADGDSLRKINESEPATMRKLLESQKVSADQMLKKLMSGHSSNIPIATGPPNAMDMNIPTGSVGSVQQIGTTGRLTVTPNVNKSIGSLPTRPTATATGTPPLTPINKSTANISTPAIQLPLRMHPNLKITAVASADSVGVLPVTPNNVASAVPSIVQQPVAPPSMPTQMPLITPVPLSTLQNAPTPGFGGPNELIVEKPNVNIDKMQAELEELRRTVALLAEAQQKNVIGISR